MVGVRYARAVVACVLALTTSRAVRAQSGETLETKVTAVRSLVILEWGKKHPWADQFTGGSVPTLLAEYRAGTGERAVDCLPPDPAYSRPGCVGVVPAIDLQQRRLNYQLPSQLVRAPAGNVCLLFRMPDGRLLPIRRADDNHRETARFRYASWEATVTARATRESLERRVGALRDSLRMVDQRIAQRTKENQRYGGQTLAECDAMPAPSLSGSGGTPRPFATAESQPRVASLVCVSRVRDMQTLVDGYVQRRQRAGTVTNTDSVWLSYRRVVPPMLLDSLLSRMSPAMQKRVRDVRGEQLNQYRGDWTAITSAMSSEYIAERRRRGEAPHFGPVFGEELSWIRVQSIPAAIGKRLAASGGFKGRGDSSDVAGYIGANLQAYSECVQDGREQMAVASATRTTLLAQDSALRSRIHTDLIRRCRTGVEVLEQLRQQRRAMDERLQGLAAQQASGDNGPLSSAERPQELNRATCSP